VSGNATPAAANRAGFRLALLVFGLMSSVSTNLFAEDQGTNYLDRVTASARFGFNLSARFRGLASLPQPMSSRLTPSGGRYNYDDGYALADISGNHDGQTWYWGYDSSASQISGNNILLSRSSVTGGAPPQSLDSDPTIGAEIVYRRQLFVQKNGRFGFEVAANYQNMHVSGSSYGTANVNRTTDAYPYTTGTTPPTATSSSPYQGSFEGPGFVIGDSPVSSTTTVITDGATVVGSQHLETDIWGFRLGPYLDIPLADQWTLSFSGGLAVGLINPSVSWSETVSVAGGGAGSISASASDSRALWGGYFAGSLTWQLSDRWSLLAGVQYQKLQEYEHSFAGQKVELNLQSSFFLTMGVGFSF
jgi:hypothetical protein